LKPDIHVFRAGDLRLAYAPVPDSLYALDEVAFDALSALVAGEGLAAVRTVVTRRHGAEAAERCLAELADLAEEDGLEVPDPLAASAPDDLGWLPSGPARPLLRALCLNVAHDCDLRCGYCFADQGGFGGRRGLMTAATAREAVDFLLEHSGDSSRAEIDFFGGEPLLNLEVVRETVDYARSRERAGAKRISFTITTNAFALGPDEAGYLDEVMDNIVLSLDGRPEVHDRMRRSAKGGPTHARTLENILRLAARRGDRDYWVRGTYTALNLDFTADVAYLASQGLRRLSLEPVVSPSERAPAWALRPDHLPRIAQEYLKLADFVLGETIHGRQILFFHFMTGKGERSSCYAKRVRGCGAGREYVCVTPDGSVWPCHQFAGRDGFTLGALADFAASSGSAWGRVPDSAARVGRQWVGSKETCRQCWARYRCSGGCHANAHAATGDVARPDPLGCQILRARLEAALYLEAQLAMACYRQ